MEGEIPQTRCTGTFKLNVQGQYRLELSVQRLCKHPDSSLAAMFSGRHTVNLNEQGEVFVDRDPQVFKHIVYYLNHDMLPSVQSVEELYLLKRELDYFCLPSLEQILRDQSFTTPKLRELYMALLYEQNNLILSKGCKINLAFMDCVMKSESYD